jgi:hypothetical protein
LAGDEGADGTATPSAIEQQIVANPKALEKVLSMQDDPRMRSVLRDKKVMEAIKSGDLSILMNDPRIGDLMKDPTVRSIAEDVEQ